MSRQDATAATATAAGATAAAAADTTTDRERTRTAILDVASRLLGDGGPGAVTTRAVALAAAVQPPTIYRLFGDKDGLLDAVAEEVFTAYVGAKLATEQSRNPVADLDDGWNAHVGFGLANPAVFALMADPQRRNRVSAETAGQNILSDRVHRVAAAGRLAVTEQRATDMIHSAGTGVVLTLLAMPSETRDPHLADAVYEAIKASIISDTAPATDATAATAATTLRAHLAHAVTLSEGERTLMTEWLDRIADDDCADMHPSKGTR